MVIQTALFTHESLQLLSRACLNSFSSKYCSYLLKLIYIWGHFVTVNNHHYGRCYMKIFIPLRGKFSNIVSKCFLRVFRGFGYYVFWGNERNERHHFSAYRVKNTCRIRKPLTCGSWFTNSSRVLPTSRVVCQLITHRNLWSIA